MVIRFKELMDDSTLRSEEKNGTYLKTTTWPFHHGRGSGSRIQAFPGRYGR